ncbi:hypothetical protein QP141_05880 [Alloscardovia omnicolens]|jgi:putative membrane protein|uniref:Transporter, major facilitator family protein n=1 Tax=Alloscardovia omnicolens F0580 TaxID=1321816 RepID=U1RBJ4_9BIFI|nr:hypothetical protein [Alloscardovia omnicolens]ERH31391.1 hypothetical protein HMPREF9244_00424 [Alloscardovia omnicolens F0580]MDK6249958.1 hypothetical protein [Alloscardovia omnicolens]MDK6251092.1 hypothetical protein [Alloscardovia omnicolens]MDK6522604.1 hypothetical protein [Alloscardovia omnicolens]
MSNMQILHTGWRSFPFNFRQLVYGKSLLNIADSFYAVALSVGLVSVYHIEAGQLSTFTLIAMIPAMFGFLFGARIDAIKAKKNWLIACQSMYVLLVIVMIICMYTRVPIAILCTVNFLFYCLTSVMGALDTSIVPPALNDDEELIERSVDIQYLTGNILNIASNFAASVLLGVITYFIVLNLSIPFFIAGIYFFWRMKISVRETTSPSENSTDITQYSFQDSIRYFSQQRVPSAIIVCEAFLSGALDVLFALAPLYLVSIHVDIAWLGLVIAIQQGADLLGSVCAPFIRIRPTHFFCWDYIISGTALLLVFVVPWIPAKIITFAIGYFVIGISGNYFSKMLFSSYDHQRLGSVDTIIRSLYAIFGIAFLLIPNFYSNITVLGIVFNGITILFGIVLALHIYTKRRK